MGDWQLSEEERELEIVLRREAADARPEFRDGLHGQIMAAVREELAVRDGAVASLVATSRRALLFAAASVALVVIGISWLLPGDETDGVAGVSEQQVEPIAADEGDSVLDSVLLAAVDVFAVAPLSDPDASDSSSDLAEHLAQSKGSSAEQWDDIAHDVEILANVLFDPFATGETETP